MLPVRINLLLIFVTLLFSCDTKTKDEKNSRETIVRSKDELTAKSIVDNKQGSIKKEIVNQSSRKNKKSSPKNSFIENDLVRSKKPPQPFIILPDKDTTLNGEEGTVIKIKQGSFVYAGTNIDVTEAVTFNITEYYKLSDILLANLSTESNGRMLETGGMLFIEALAEGKQCELKNGSTIEIQFPYSERKEGMQLFTGKWEKENLNWEELQVLQDSTLVTEEGAPEYPGGIRALNSFFSQRVKYFDSMLGFRGTITVAVDFDETGKVINAKIREPYLQRYNRIIQNLFFKMPRWKPATRNGKPIKFSLIQPLTYISYESEYPDFPDTAFQKEFEEFITTDTTLINEIPAVTISRYIFSSSKLGWINCDRFFNDSRQKLDLFVKTGEYDDLNIKLVFHSIKSIVTGAQIGNSYNFKQVPIDEKVTVVAIGKRNQRNFVAFGDYSTNSGTVDNLVFQQVTNEGLKDALRKLDSIVQEK